MAEIHPIDLNEKTVFVLGAGASKPYDFPLGSELIFTMGMNLNITSLNNIIGNKFEKSLASDFIEALKRTSHPTIDAFLEKKTRFREIGSYAIAHILLLRENRSQLFPPKDWYDHIYHVLSFENEKPDTNNIVFVTLNYDRSLEHFLKKNIEYNCADNLIKHTSSKLSKLQIIHAYGSLGQYPQIEYGANHRDGLILRKAAEGIRITSDRLEDTSEFHAAKMSINDAFNLVFLGFGYDQTTLKLLIKDIDLSNKRFLGTIYNLPKTKLESAISLLKREIEVIDFGASADTFIKTYLPLGYI